MACLVVAGCEAHAANVVDGATRSDGSAAADAAIRPDGHTLTEDASTLTDGAHLAPDAPTSAGGLRPNPKLVPRTVITSWTEPDGSARVARTDAASSAAFDGVLYDDNRTWSSWPASNGTLAATSIVCEIATPADALLWTWSDLATSDWLNAVDYQGSPSAYHIDVAPAEDGPWTTVVDYTTPAGGDTYRSRAHRFAFAGMHWVRMVALAVQAHDGRGDRMILHEIEIHDATNGLDDSWVFAGSAATRFAWDGHTHHRWPVLVHERHAAFDPAVIDIADVPSALADFRTNLDRWLTLVPDHHRWVLVFGLGDAEGNRTPAETGFEADLRAVVDRLIADGRVPIIPRVQATDPTLDDQHAHIDDFNAVIDRVVSDYHLTQVADFHAWFAAHPEQFCRSGCESRADEGVTPVEPGYESMNDLWATSVDGLYTP